MRNSTELHGTVQEIARLLKEHGELTSKPSFSKQDEARASGLLARIAVLKKDGVSVDDLNIAQAEAYRQELGLPRIPSHNFSAEFRSAFRHWITTGEERKIETRTNDQQFAMWGRPTGQTFTGGDEQGGTTSGIAGGYTTPAGFLANKATMNLGSVDEILDYATTIETDKGGFVAIPVVGDISGSPASYIQSQIVPDATQITQGTSLVGFQNNYAYLNSYKILSALPVAFELSTDAADAFAVLLPMVFQQRHALACGNYAINGSGSGQPLGLWTIAGSLPSSNVITSGSSSAPALVDFQKAIAQMPRAYRRQSAWFMNTESFLAVSEFLETASRPDVGSFQTLLHIPIAVCDSAPALGSGVIAAVLAPPRYLYKRAVKNSATFERFIETSNYVERGMCLVRSHFRFDFLCTLYASSLPPYVAIKLA